MNHYGGLNRVLYRRPPRGSHGKSLERLRYAFPMLVASPVAIRVVSCGAKLVALGEDLDYEIYR